MLIQIVRGTDNRCPDQCAVIWRLCHPLAVLIQILLLGRKNICHQSTIMCCKESSRPPGKDPESSFEFDASSSSSSESRGNSALDDNKSDDDESDVTPADYSHHSQSTDLLKCVHYDELNYKR